MEFKGIQAARIISGALEGMDARAVAGFDAPIIWIVRNEARLARARMALAFFAPDRLVIEIPAFDCLPYDRFSPSFFIAAQRAAGLARLAASEADKAKPCIVIISLNAVMQRVPPSSMMLAHSMELRAGAMTDFKKLNQDLQISGYQSVDIVANAGEYALRGGIVDIYPAGHAGENNPVRIDFFGDEIEDIRFFDADSQRSHQHTDSVDLFPASEILLTQQAITHFRTAYAGKFGFAKSADGLYAAISAGQRIQGMEHFMPLFYPKMATVFDYIPQASIILDDGVDAMLDEHWATITMCHEGRVQDQQIMRKAASREIYNPLPPEEFYLNRLEWQEKLESRAIMQLSLFAAGSQDIQSIDGRPGQDFTEARKRSDLSLMDEVAAHIKEVKKYGKRVLLAAHNPVQLERLTKLFSGHDIGLIRPAVHWQEVQQFPPDTIATIRLDIERGVAAKDFIILCEEDIAGERPVRRRSSRSKRARSQLMQGEAIQPGDFVVHADHGIGRFAGLKRIEAGGIAHDCLMIFYANDDRLFIPVENADLVTRYGAATGEVVLDRLGTNLWSSRKERVKRKLWEMAAQLIALAAAREEAHTQPVLPASGFYEEFCSRFPFDETDDQQQAIADVLADLGGTRPMDRLICGDVGFGKTEIALRAVFVSVMSGKQAAVIAPTTLLCRQHVDVFTKRFEGFPVRIGQLSRLVPRQQIKEVHRTLIDGTLDIVIGTHALLSSETKFHDLGLIVIDEEQHFGVSDKERLKEMRNNIHILTLTATPIPRTLQLALSGAREISLIGDPPAGRLPVHNFIGPFDRPTLRMALLREHNRGGRSFFICPRVRDLEEAAKFLNDHVPELRAVIAHGRMKPDQLEQNIGAFYDGVADVLLSTHIVEAGLDVSEANTLIVWHAHMFGLAQLHQLRGRIGRGKTRAYAYFTLPKNHALTFSAEERLLALSAMDSLGAGFSLAARDLDIRGAGNLLGKEQSGHIREIGYELYQKMLAEAVAQRRESGVLQKTEEKWSPQVRLSTTILIPENYISDMRLRLSFYRRIAQLETDEDIKQLREDIIDRFGALPASFQSLLDVVRLKLSCYAVGVESLDISATGVRIGFYQNRFANPAGLVQFIENESGAAKLTTDHYLIIKRNWPDIASQFTGAGEILHQLKKIN